MDDYTLGMSAAQEIQWCSNRILELYPIAEAEFFAAKDALRVAKSSWKRKYHKKSEYRQCTYCGKPDVYAKGLCRSCYARLHRNGHLEYSAKEEADDCEKQKKPWYALIHDEIFGATELYPDDLERGVSHALEQLDERRRATLLERYKEGKTLFEIGQGLGVSRERARQVILSGISTLRNPKTAIYIELGFSKAEEAIQENEAKTAELRKRAIEVLSKKYIKDAKSFVAPLEEGIESLEIGVRAYNCLMRGGIRTIGDLVNYAGFPLDKDKLCQFNLLGRKTAEEISTRFEQYIRNCEVTSNAQTG